PHEVPVPVAMDADLVAGGGYLGCELRPALDLLADEEERRPHVCPLERGEHGARPLWMWPVVERQRDGVRTIDRGANAEQPPHPRRHERGGGKPIRCRT